MTKIQCLTEAANLKDQAERNREGWLLAGTPWKHGQALDAAAMYIGAANIRTLTERREFLKGHE